ncbi:serine hydroxymethyltransferase [Paenibacillus athensensis]|uniref:Probable serine hydroxymethyltransferase n=1 Tax=Paenibacillus athensensis TaxID=1967502 RepID=A0A4Y8PTG0_9BACL|nr:serine hydroxymethyltransferase [Paenibacillus athensensis]MCD1260552.1 serine hydroxymethyltransferase [Paenibacillus athensensis]
MNIPALQENRTRSVALPVFSKYAAELLVENDPKLADLLSEEYARQMSTLSLVAASSTQHPSVLAASGSVLSNLTTEGYPGARYHGGCEIADQIELLAIERAKKLFNAQYVNVQPHSGTSANEIVIFNLLNPGDTILGLHINAGGHLSHGAKASTISKYFNCINYGLTEQGILDYDDIYRLAQQHRPKLIICGASAYPRAIDFAKFREISDSVGAFLLADISHIAGLVAARLHESPIDHAHFTTTSTYKQLLGPRGGLIMMGKDYMCTSDSNKNLKQIIDRGTFPGFQGTPDLAGIAAKARALDYASTPAFVEYANNIVHQAAKLCNLFLKKGYSILTGGTDNHLFLINVKEMGLTGVVAERALESCGLIVNKNIIPGDTEPPTITSGLRIGTNNTAMRGITDADLVECADLIDQVLRSTRLLTSSTYMLEHHVKTHVRSRVHTLAEYRPIPKYL